MAIKPYIFVIFQGDPDPQPPPPPTPLDPRMELRLTSEIHMMHLFQVR